MFILEGNTKIIQKATIYNCVTGEINLYLTDTHELHIDDKLYDDYNIEVNIKVKQIVKVTDTLAAILSVSGDLAFFGEFDPIMLKGIVHPMDEKHNTPNQAAVFNINPELRFMRNIKKLAVFDGNLYLLKYDGKLCAIGANKVIALNGLPIKEDYYGIKHDIQCLNTKVVDICVNNRINKLYLIVNTDNLYGENPYNRNDFSVYSYTCNDEADISIEKMNIEDDVFLDANSSFLGAIKRYSDPIIIGPGNIYAAANSSYFKLEGFYPGKVECIIPWYIDSVSRIIMLNVYVNNRIGMITMSGRELWAITNKEINKKIKQKEELKSKDEVDKSPKKKAPPKKVKETKKEEAAKEEEVKE